VVSLVEVLWGRLKIKEFVCFGLSQVMGGIVGVWLTHAMFGLSLFEISTKHRESFSLALSEFIATFGLILTIALAGKKHVEWVPITIALYITSAYWFTSSTSFANPAVTIARSLTDTFCGIAPAGIASFIVAQVLGGLAAYKVTKLIAR
jgi:glycerol uptake facilitator-like aquaporin